MQIGDGDWGGLGGGDEVGGFAEGVDGGGAGGFVIELVEGLVEGFCADGSVVIELNESIEEGLDVDDAGGCGQFAFVVFLLVLVDACWGVVEVDGDDILVGEVLGEVFGGVTGLPPVPAIEDEADVAGLDGADEVESFGESMEEGVAVTDEGGMGADVFEAEAEVVVAEDGGDGAQSVAVEFEVLEVSQVVTSGADPGIDAGNAGLLEGGGGCGEGFEVGLEAGFIAAEIDGESGGAPGEVFGFEVVEHSLA